MIRTRRGFSTPELMIVVGILLIVLSMALPTVQTAIQGYRLMGDARGIAAQLSLARMLAASNFTRSAVYFDTTAQTFQVEVWSKSGGILQPVGGAQPLSQGDLFGYGSLTIPAGGQTTISQTTPIYFNSRGVAVDNSGNSKGDSAIYITNKQGAYCAISVSVAGQPSVWKFKGSAWVSF
jgi:prepilin-type N-terminal cleavage/methylation domain-containing protein